MIDASHETIPAPSAADIHTKQWTKTWDHLYFKALRHKLSMNVNADMAWWGRIRKCWVKPCWISMEAIWDNAVAKSRAWCVLQYWISVRKTIWNSNLVKSGSPLTYLLVIQNFHRTRQWYCRAQCKISVRLDNYNACNGRTGFREIWV